MEYRFISIYKWISMKPLLVKYLEHSIVAYISSSSQMRKMALI